MTWPDSGGEVAISGRNLVHSLGKTATKNGPLGFRAIAGFIYGVGEFLQFFGLRRQTSYWSQGECYATRISSTVVHRHGTSCKVLAPSKISLTVVQHNKKAG
jgi:hypothetical protein